MAYTSALAEAWFPSPVRIPQSQSGHRANPANDSSNRTPLLGEEEYQRLLAETHVSRDRAILEVFLQTGLRLSEFANLNLHDLELPKRITNRLEGLRGGCGLVRGAGGNTGRSW
jgi:integrase